MNEVEILELIHTDLSAIISFLVFFVIIILCYFVYKFFDMVFRF